MGGGIHRVLILDLTHSAPAAIPAIQPSHPSSVLVGIFYMRTSFLVGFLLLVYLLYWSTYPCTGPRGSSLSFSLSFSLRATNTRAHQYLHWHATVSTSHKRVFVEQYCVSTRTHALLLVGCSWRYPIPAKLEQARRCSIAPDQSPAKFLSHLHRPASTSINQHPPSLLRPPVP